MGMPDPEMCAADTSAEPGHYDDLDAVLSTAEAMLRQGVLDRRAPFHTPVLATVGVDGYPAARTVVLRAFDPAARRLRVHSDARSAKASEIARLGRVALVFYDGPAKIQVRIGASGQVLQEDRTRAGAWESLSALARRCYHCLPPGQTQGFATSGLLDDPATPAAGAPSPGYANFAVIEMTIDSLEWLFLSVRGHRRARFTWTAEGTEGTWLTP
jgi:hypothetical protein